MIKKLSKIKYKILQSHFMQVYLTLSLNAKNVLEIGKETGFVSSILNQHCNLTTLDSQEEFEPNLLIDITDLKQLDTLENETYDLILLCEVLEHIPYERIDGILEILEKKTSKYLIISIPNHTTYVNLILFNHSIKFKTLKNYFNLFFSMIQKLISKLDYFFRTKRKKFNLIKHEQEWQTHQWELGIDKYSINSFKKLLQKNFTLIRDERHKDHPYHHFFILKKRYKNVKKKE